MNTIPAALARECAPKIKIIIFTIYIYIYIYIYLRMLLSM